MYSKWKFQQKNHSFSIQKQYLKSETGLPLVFQKKSSEFSLIFSEKFYLFPPDFPDILITHTYYIIISLDRYGVSESLEPILGYLIFGFIAKTELHFKMTA